MERLQYLMLTNTVETWNSVLTEIRSKIPHDSYVTWFDNTTLVESTETKLVIGVPNKFIKSFLIEKFYNTIKDSIYTIIGNPSEIQFKVIPELRNKIEEARKKGRNLREDSEDSLNTNNSDTNLESNKDDSPVELPYDESQYQGLPLVPSYNFENFIVGPSNRMAYSGALSIIESPGLYNPLFLYGQSGLGKTHLLHAICHELKKKKNNSRIIFISCEEFINDFIQHIRTSQMEEFRNKYRKLDALIIDDIHFLGKGNKDSTQDEFFHTFDALYNTSCQIIVSSDAHPKDIEKLKEKIQMRFVSGLVASVDLPNFSTKLKILKQKCKERNYNFSNDILELIAQNVTSNIRELEGAMIKIYAISKFNNQEVTTELAKQALDISKKCYFNCRTSSEEVLKVAADFFNMTIQNLKAPKRGKNAIPRKLTMLALRKIFSFSYQDISTTFGCKSHASVVYAEKAILSSLEKDPTIQLGFEKFSDYLKEQFQ